ncbi:sensor histidine kinase [Parvibaculum lavamentivorans]|nr:ATP-binding protein [Parvibaculum lavamentivorans]
MTNTLYRLAAVAMAVFIFLVDLSPIAGAVAVLYVLVILTASRVQRVEEIVAAASLSIALTIAAYLLSHDLGTLGPATLRAGVSIGAIAIATLLTLQNLAATRALSSQARLLNLSHDMMFARDPSGLVTFWNHAAEATYGWAASEAVGRSADELLQTRYPENRDAIETCVIGSGRWEGTLEHRTRTGAWLVLESRWAAEYDSRGRMVRVLETHTDVTERNQAQDSLNLARAELAHATRVATLGELTASIAHEVNQPLMAVVTNGEAGLRWLRRDPPDLTEVEMAIGQVVAEGRRAGEIVKRVREFLRKAPSRPADIDVLSLVEDAAALVRHDLARAEVTLTLAIEPDIPKIRGDRVQFQQVLVNLMVNAAQAMADRTLPRRLAVDARRNGTAAVEVLVRDNGPGIAPEHLERLFEPFFTTKPDGMGMGLAICRTTAETYGATLSVESVLHEGTAFRFSIPVMQQEMKP